MIREEEIIELYNNFISDLKVDIVMPELKIVQLTTDYYQAQITHIDKGVAMIGLGSLFRDSRITRRYLESILYHEFTHIYDREKFLAEYRHDDRKHRDLLFPYTEFRATKNATKYDLGLFYDSQKHISLSTKIYGERESIALRESISIDDREFSNRIKELEDNPCIENVGNMMYVIAYRMGKKSILSAYDIKIEDMVGKYFLYAADEFDLLEMALNKEPCDEVCIESHRARNMALKKILEYYGLYGES